MTLRKGVDDEVPDMEGSDEEPTWTALYLDYKEPPTLDQLKAALGPFGIHVYEDPTQQFTDTFGYIFSNMALTDEKIKELCEWDEDMEACASDDGSEQVDLPGEVEDEDEDLDPEDFRGPEPGE